MIKVADSLYNPNNTDVPSVVKDLYKRVSETDSTYRDQILAKFNEYLSTISMTNNESHYLKLIRRISSDLRLLFIKESNNRFKIRFRRKSLFALLRKMNSVMANQKSINSIHDLNGMEIIIFTKGIHDTKETVSQCYEILNLALEYFAKSASTQHELFSLCDASDLKDGLVGGSYNERKEKLLELNPTAYLPEKSMVPPQYSYCVKDYYAYPKATTGYQGLQFVVKHTNLKSGKSSYMEIQIKTQPTRDYLDDPDSPGNHKKHSESKKSISDPFFDLEYSYEKASHISGFRPNPEKDMSGITSPVKWDLNYQTHD